MKYLSLFSGAGGGDLGAQHLLNLKCVGYVENEEYCQKVIRQRIIDGILDAAPIFGDIRNFNSENYAEQYKGMVDIVTGGFPCQPFSVSGKQLGANDPRNMWPETIRTIRTIRPKYAFLENVPGLIISGYFGTIVGDLWESGYNCRWRILSASEVGATHKRDRLWIFAYSTTDGLQAWSRKKNEPCWVSEQSQRFCKNVSHTKRKRLKKSWGPWLVISKKTFREGKTNQFVYGSWWTAEPDVGRVANGVANRAYRLKAIGNGQVPLTMALAFSILSKGIV